MLEVTLLGTGGSMPLPNRYLSALLLQYKGRKLLVDCGEGTQVAMKEINSGFKTLDMICLTHLHGDHINGLPGLLATVGNSGRTEPILMMVPVGTKEVLEAIQILVPHLPFGIQILEKPVDSYILTERYFNDEIQISSIELDHSAPCLGYCFEVKRRPKFDVEKAIMNEVPRHLWGILQKNTGQVQYHNKTYRSEMVLGVSRQGIKFSFITDTRPIGAIVPFIEKSDLFICEGTYGDESERVKAVAHKHMTFSEAATLAKQGQVRELLLTHFGVVMSEPERYLDQARQIFQNTDVGKDHQTKTLNFQ